MDKKIIIETIVVGELGTNCYLVASSKTKDALLIDPGADADIIKKVLNNLKLSLKFIVLTHGHYDHIGALEDFNVPVYVHENDLEFLKNNNLNLGGDFARREKLNFEVKLLHDKDKISLADLELEVMHTPGHTPGGISLRLNKILFSGDTLFYHGIGRTDLPGGSFKQITHSIKERIFELEEDTIVFPGHGSATTIGTEKKENGYV